MKRIEHREQDWIFPFIEYSPDKREGKLPLIVGLHGAGERGNGQDELKLVEIHGFVHYLRAEPREDCIVIFPQCPKDTFWAARVESILKFIDQLIEHYNVDEDRVYLTGLSMGGFGTWFCAMAAPQKFAAIAPMCGGGMGWNAHVLRMPVWAFHGTADGAVDVFYSDDMVKKLTASGGNVKYTRLDGVDHNCWAQSYNRELFDWLLAQKR